MDYSYFLLSMIWVLPCTLRYFVLLLRLVYLQIAHQITECCRQNYRYNWKISRPGKAMVPKAATSLSTKKLKWEWRAEVRATWTDDSFFVRSTALRIFSICFCNIAFYKRIEKKVIIYCPKIQHNKSIKNKPVVRNLCWLYEVDAARSLLTYCVVKIALWKSECQLLCDNHPLYL